MPIDPRVDEVLSDLRDWCAVKHGRQGEAANVLGVRRQQVYDWTVKRRMPTAAMFLKIQAFLKTQRDKEKTEAKPKAKKIKRAGVGR